MPATHPIRSPYVWAPMAFLTLLPLAFGAWMICLLLAALFGVLIIGPLWPSSSHRPMSEVDRAHWQDFPEWDEPVAYELVSGEVVEPLELAPPRRQIGDGR